MAAQVLSVGLVAASSLLVGVRGETMGQRCNAQAQGQCGGECRWHTGQCRQICFRTGTAYTGDMPGSTVTHHGTQEMCRLHCQNNVGCVHFTYYSSTKACHVHDGDAARQAMTGAVSGEPDCQPVGDGSGMGVHRPPQNPPPAPIAESMPQNVAGVMKAGAANSGFSGLSELPPSAGASVERAWRVPPTAAAAGLLSLVAVGFVTRALARARQEAPVEAQQLMAAAAAEAVDE